jgi:hypothetical protein
VYLLEWLKKGKLWYFALWVFVMSPVTMTLYLTAPEKIEVPPPAVQSVDEYEVVGVQMYCTASIV